jgi:hypothetical protein
MDVAGLHELISAQVRKIPNSALSELGGKSYGTCAFWVNRMPSLLALG